MRLPVLNPALQVMTIIHSLLHTTLKDWSTMIGQYTHYSISYPSFHTYTYINKFCDDIIFFFYIRKIQDTDDWTLVAVLFMGNFTSISIKPETCFYTSIPLENKFDKSTGSMCKNQRCERLG